MRHSILSCGALLFVAACTASGSDGAQHGPAFDLDASQGEGGAHDATTSLDAHVPPVDAGHDAAPPVDAAVDASLPMDASLDAPTPVDAGLDAPGTLPDATPPVDAAGCTSTAALVAGGAAALFASSFASGTWSAAAPVTGGAAASAPAVVAFGQSFAAVVVKPSDKTLASFTIASAPSSLTTVGSLTARDAPALGVVGGALHLVYQGASDYKFYHGTFSASAWDAANDPVGGAGAAQSFGPSGPSVAVAAGALVVAQGGAVPQGGTDGLLYDQSWNGAWAAASPHAATSVEPGLRPTIVALTGGTADLLVVYLRKTDRHLMWTARTGTTWSPATEVYDMAGNVAFSNDPVSLAPLAGGGAVVAFRGSNGLGYFATWNGSTWTAPAAIVPGGGAALASPPALAAGICGAEAIGVLVDAATGAVSVTELVGSGWSSPPQPVAGLSGAVYAGVATAP